VDDLPTLVAACLAAHAMNIGYRPVAKKGVPALERARLSRVYQSRPWHQAAARRAGLRRADPMGKMFFNILATLAEFEVDLLPQRHLATFAEFEVDLLPQRHVAPRSSFRRSLWPQPLLPPPATIRLPRTTTETP
jgi:hypothetical protein